MISSATKMIHLQYKIDKTSVITEFQEIAVFELKRNIVT